jgi:hypothetical protein
VEGNKILWKNQKIKVEFGLPNSIGMDAKEAALIYKDTRYVPPSR